ncbi:hypothetical protein AB0E96_00550 [Kitasatospora sp. NPDC036755]|uniref:hypothetical protein n=1 Tax=Kitasatospora sp. NPDC036755 TaxID=3154600 RepID=UPI00340DB214
MTKSESTVASALADTAASLAGLGAAQGELRDEPSRLDVVVNRDALTGRTKIHGYLNGHAVVRTEVRFNPAEPRLHLHVADSGSPSEPRNHAWAQTVQDTGGAPDAVADHLAKLVHDYHRPRQGCEECGTFAHLPDAPKWTVVLNSDTEIEQIRKGVPSRREANNLGLAGHTYFVLPARSLLAAHARALAVLDDLLDHGQDIAGHVLVDAEATEGKYNPR